MEEGLSLFVGCLFGEFVSDCSLATQRQGAEPPRGLVG